MFEVMPLCMSCLCCLAAGGGTCVLANVFGTNFVFLILLRILKVLCSLDASLNGNTIVLVISSSISLSI